jgi:nucleotide-binding universal stress UspA family protein
MKGQSYLIVLDGSAESRAAAYLAWNLAQKTDALVVAQHVINVPAVWRMLSLKTPGFVGSGLYVEAAERIKEALQGIAEGIMLSYSAQADGQNIETETYIDEGDPLVEIGKRAKSHDMIIIGYDKNAHQSGQNITLSLCEQLAEICSCSMLIVNTVCDNWSKTHALAVASSFKSDPSMSHEFRTIASSLALPAEVRSLKAARSEGTVPSYIRNCTKPALFLWQQAYVPQALAS